MLAFTFDESLIKKWKLFLKRNPEDSSAIQDAILYIYENKLDAYLVDDKVINKIKKARDYKRFVKVKGKELHPKDNASFFFVLAYSFTVRDNLLTINDETLFDKIIQICHQEHAYDKLKLLLDNFLIVYSHFSPNNLVKIFNESDFTDPHKVFWTVYHSFCDTLGYLKLEELDGFIEFLSVVQKITENDMAVGALYNSVENLAELKPTFAKKTFNRIKSIDKEELKLFISPLLSGLSNIIGIKASYEMAEKLIRLKNSDNVCQGLFVLSRFSYKGKNKSYLKTTLKTYNEIIKNKTNDEYLIWLAKGLGIMLGKAINVKQELVDISVSKIVGVQYELATILFLNCKQNAAEEWFSRVLMNLSEVDTKYRGVINQLDLCLNTLHKINPELVYKFIQEWIECHQNTGREETLAKLFKMLTLSLYVNHYPLLIKFLTMCFNIDSENYHSTVAEILHELSILGQKNISLDKELLDTYTNEEIHFVITKIMGYLFEYVLLQKLVFSVLQRTNIDNKIKYMVVSSFTSYIGYNYPDSTEKFLNEYLANGSDIEQSVARDILNIQQNYYNEIKKLPRLKEFEAPSRRARMYILEKRKLESQRMHKIKNETSILMQLATKVTLKGGRHWYSKLPTGYTIKSPLQEFSLSYEEPRGEFINQLEQELFRLQCKTLRRNSE